VLAGVASFLVFLIGRSLVLEIGILRGPLADLLRTADAASRAPVLALAWASAVTEELFFRGTLIDAVRRRWAAVAGVLPYVVTTAFSGNPALIIAGLVMGAVFTALRLWRDSLVAPILCHLVWSTLMITALPR
jgi:membrane protease YdiL (CAAX protease family)